jgi:four helix bundle protein
MSIGSFELETQLIIAEKLGYISNEQLSNELHSLNGLQRQINGLISKIKNT